VFHYTPPSTKSYCWVLLTAGAFNGPVGAFNVLTAVPVGAFKRLFIRRVEKGVEPSVYITEEHVIRILAGEAVENMFCMVECCGASVSNVRRIGYTRELLKCM